MFDVITYILSRRGIGSYTPSGGGGGNVMDVKVNGASVVNAGGVANVSVPTSAEDVGAIAAPSVATSSDVGKVLKVKTVSDGKVTEYEFGDAVTIDDTLSNSGEAADAKVTGDKVKELKDHVDQISEAYNYYDPNATYTQTNAEGQPRSGYTINADGSISILRSLQQYGQIYLVDNSRTIGPGKYVIAGKMTLTAETPDSNRVTAVVGRMATSRSVAMTTTKDGNTPLPVGDKVGWFKAEFELTEEQPFMFECIPYVSSMVDAEHPAKIEDLTITTLTALTAYDKTARRDISGLKSSVVALEPVATAGDVGKMLKVKSVTGGKATEYEFGDAVTIDATLNNSGEAADAKVTGDRISKMNNVLNYANLVNAFDGTLFQGYWTSAGVRTSYNSDVCNANKIPCPAGATVTLTAQTNVSGLSYYMSYLDDTGRLLRDTGTGTTYTGQAPAGTKWFCFCFEKTGLQPSDFTGVSVYINSLVDKVDGLTAEVDKLNDEIGQIGISSRVKTALLDCFRYVAWIGANGQTYYDALESALNGSIEVWETVRTFASSDLSYKKQMNGVPPTYYNDKNSRASYLAFDIPVEYGYIYKFEYTTTLAASNIAFAFYNQNAYNAVQNQQRFTNAELLETNWAASGYEIAVPATINGSPIKGVRFTFRADDSTSSTSFQGGEITSVTIKRRRNS